MQIHNLNQLKKALCVGDVVHCLSTSHFVNRDGSSTPSPTAGKTRFIAKKQTNAIKFDDNSWLYLDKARDMRFYGDNRFSQVIEYNGQIQGQLDYKIIEAE